MKLKISKERMAIVRESGTLITTDEGNKYLRLPFWFKDLGDDVYEVYEQWDTPKDLDRQLRENRIQGNQAKRGLEI